MNTPNENSSPNGGSHKSQRVSMRLIAEKIGVTKTTVSLALRGHKSISAATRDKVKNLADKLGYRPDPAISAIAAQRWSSQSQDRHRVIAFLCHNDPRSKMYQKGYLPAAQKRAEEYGYKLEKFHVDEYPTAESVTRVLYARGIRGIIVPAIHNPESKRAINIDWSKFTAVCCGVGRVLPPLHVVTNDIFATTRLIWETVARAGHKRVGASLFCHSPIADDDWERVGASTAAMKLLGLSESEKIPIHTGHVDEEDSLMEWYEKYRPEVIIGFNQTVGETLERCGVKIPEDVEFISLISHSGSRWSGLFRHTNDIAIAAVDLLNNEIRENNWGQPAAPHATHIQPDWNQGSTYRFSPPKGIKVVPYTQEAVPVEN
ncbi:LacI family transcriptional regulator [Puniceicoccaceae bacterium K14]|nr:LacI family transcriptional regulator [Puniceicoccaceae bacterium K14]